ncbi:T7SS effector LXG polymorphic toxin [Paenilisteria rocourtiae]|uniref:WXG superfamily protein probably secreted by type VII secretion system n=1 Tax=Listeria rocourtiae TaxID=647910 RepID=A0A4R6ZPZ8_9LIST|nr:T7SS effector LXG polymorphic toxin [Listeria rocourtiae]EUJ43743.1 hypothetical protein PROCOU_15209 [Listeria rocourtiae FSL F6-920]MBC1604160.1 hypothetical protein [Listeria rocourtiae]TDR54663.1 WXG superfamily protein probably secreted by type VII secretion system [Listeria rocourtiae]
MSVDMYVSESQGQAASVSNLAKQQIIGYEQLQKAINEFAMNSPFLTGQAYDSAKAFFTAVLYPLAQGGILLSEAVEQAVKKFPEEYISRVDSGDLKQSELEEKIRQTDDLITQAEDIRRQLQSSSTPDIVKFFQLSANATMIGLYNNIKKELEEKLRKLMDFHASSPTIFEEISVLQQAVKQGLSQTKTGFNPTTGSFTIPAQKDLAWTSIISRQVENKNTQFIESIQKKLPNLSEEEKIALFKFAQNNPEIEPPQDIIDYFMNDVGEIPQSIKDSLPQDLFSTTVESSGKAVQSFGFFLTALTGKMGPGGSGNFVMVNPNTSAVTTSIIKAGNTISKFGKFGLPVIGGVIDGVTQIVSGENVGDAVIKSVVHVGIGLAGGEAGAAIGGVIGTAIPIPVVGTLVGAALGFVVGVGITAVGNYLFDKVYDKKDEIIKGAKDVVKSVGDTIGNAASGFMNGLGSLFG